MAEHPNATLARELTDALNRGDMAALDRLIADDVVWHEIGRSEPRRGKAALAATAAADYSITGTLHDVVANDEHTIALVEASATRGGKILHLPDGGDLPRPQRQGRRAMGVLRRHGGDHGVLRLALAPTPTRGGRHVRNNRAAAHSEGCRGQTSRATGRHGRAPGGGVHRQLCVPARQRSTGPDAGCAIHRPRRLRTERRRPRPGCGVPKAA